MFGRLRLLTSLMLAVASLACGSSPPQPTKPTPVLPVANPSVVSANQDAIAAVSSLQFDGSRSTSSAASGITGYAWNFGDGSLATGVSVQHVFNTSGTKSVMLAVTDANGTSNAASATVTVKDITGSWRAQFNVQTRTYSLIQTGTVITGTYTNTQLAREIWPVNGSVDANRRFTVTATYPGETTVVLSNATVDAAVSSFTGVTFGGSANGQTLTYQRVP
jgi:PKD repeat protein